MTNHTNDPQAFDSLKRQAEAIEDLLPRLARRMFHLQENHPVLDMPVGQLRVCAALMRGPMTLTALSDEMNATVSAATQIADRMEKVGLVVRSLGTDDRRLRFITLSETGQELMRSRRLMRQAQAEEVLAALSPDDRTKFVEILSRALAAAQTKWNHQDHNELDPADVDLP